jgi:serine/threonine-protein kinase RsbW
MQMSSTQDAVRLKIPGDARYLALVRQVISVLAAGAGFPDEEVAKIEISVDEACTNVLDHAYRHSSPKPPIEVEIRFAPGQLVVDVIDQGKTFDFGAYVPPKLPDHWMNGQTRGVGLYLIRKCMDEMSYEQAGPVNRLRLVKRLRQVS